MNKKIFMKRAGMVLAMMFIAIIPILAQSGAAGITQAATEIKSYIAPIKMLMWAIGGVVGIIGGIRVYIKWNNGDQDVNKELMMWGGAMIFLIIVPVVVEAFFG